MFDSRGRIYHVDSPITIPEGAQNNGEAEIIATQIQQVKQTYHLTESHPFYALEVENPKDGSYISTLQVSVNDEIFDPCFKFNGVRAGDKVYHVESDEYKRLYVKFGESSVLGWQPSVNDEVVIECGQCFGDIQPELGSTFALQYIQTDEENNVKFEMKALEKAGQNPLDIAMLKVHLIGLLHVCVSLLPIFTKTVTSYYNISRLYNPLSERDLSQNLPSKKSLGIHRNWFSLQVLLHLIWHLFKAYASSPKKMRK